MHFIFTSAGSTPSATPACQVMSCRKVLCLCGKTFPRRLWLLDTHLNGLKLVTKRSRIFQDQISKTPRNQTQSCNLEGAINQLSSGFIFNTWINNKY